MPEPAPISARDRARMYERARATYDRYAARISLELVGPTPEQVAAAREDTALFEAERLYLDVRLLCESAGEISNQAAVDYQLGLLYRVQGRGEESLDRLDRALVTFRCVLKPNARVHDSISLCHYYIGKALMDRGDIREARRHLKAAIEIDASTGIRHRAKACASLLERTRQPQPGR